MLRNEVIDGAPSGWLKTPSYFVFDFLGQLADPVNVAASFVPVFKGSWEAWLATKAGKATAIGMKGAVEGAVGAAMVEPIIYEAAQQEQADYDSWDSTMAIVGGLGFGAVFGMGTHAMGAMAGLYKSTVEPLSPSAKLAAQRKATAQLNKNEAVDVSDIAEVDNIRNKVGTTSEKPEKFYFDKAESDKYGLYDQNGAEITDPLVRAEMIKKKSTVEEIKFTETELKGLSDLEKQHAKSIQEGTPFQIIYDFEAKKFVEQTGKNYRWWMLTQKEPGVLHQLIRNGEARFYQMPGRDAGYGIAKDGELLMFHSNKPPKSGAGRAMLEHAIANGVDRLYVFDLHGMPKFYEKFGFETKEVYDFDPKQAPTGWNTKELGTPGVHYMELKKPTKSTALSLAEAKKKLDKLGEYSVSDDVRKEFFSANTPDKLAAFNKKHPGVSDILETERQYDKLKEAAEEAPNRAATEPKVTLDKKTNQRTYEPVAPENINTTTWYRGAAGGKVKGMTDAGKPLGRYFTTAKDYAEMFSLDKNGNPIGKVEGKRVNLNNVLDLRNKDNVDLIIDNFKNHENKDVREVIKQLEEIKSGSDRGDAIFQEMWRFLERIQKLTDGEISKFLASQGYDGLVYRQFSRTKNADVVADTLVELLDKKTTADSAGPSKKASVKFMITKQDEANLKSMGYTQEQINKMTPEEAGRILELSETLKEQQAKQRAYEQRKKDNERYTEAEAEAKIKAEVDNSVKQSGEFKPKVHHSVEGSEKVRSEVLDETPGTPEMTEILQDLENMKNLGQLTEKEVSALKKDVDREMADMNKNQEMIEQTYNCLVAAHKGGLR
jgi:hypothetical protein